MVKSIPSNIILSGARKRFIGISPSSFASTEYNISLDTFLVTRVKYIILSRPNIYLVLGLFYCPEHNPALLAESGPVIDLSWSNIEGFLFKGQSGALAEFGSLRVQTLIFIQILILSWTNHIALFKTLQLRFGENDLLPLGPILGNILQNIILPGTKSLLTPGLASLILSEPKSPLVNSELLNIILTRSNGIR